MKYNKELRAYLLMSKHNKNFFISQDVIFNKKIHIKLSINKDEDIEESIDLNLFEYYSMTF